MSEWKYIRLSVVAPTRGRGLKRLCIVALSVACAAGALAIAGSAAAPGDCRGAISGATCRGSPSAPGGSTLTASATFACHSGAGTWCDFVFSDQVLYFDPLRRQWVTYHPYEQEPWSEACGATHTYTWTGSLSGMPMGSYQLLCGFATSGHWTYDSSYFAIAPY
jgi:hypothetical protein